MQSPGLKPGVPKQVPNATTPDESRVRHESGSPTICHDDQGVGRSDSDSKSPRRPLSIATIVKLKHSISHNSLKSRSNSDLAVDDWQGVLPTHHAQAHVSTPGAGGDVTSKYPSAERTNARHGHHGSTSGSFLDSASFVQEPASYEAPPSSPFKGAHGHATRTSYISDSSSSDSHSGDEYTHPRIKATAIQPYLRLPSLTAQQRGILKCSIAYTIATLFTFLPFLSKLLAAPFDLDNALSGGHVVATVATYYNPAKTLGAMFEAVS